MSSRITRIGFVGCGVVGTVRDPKRPRSESVPVELLTDDPLPLSAIPTSTSWSKFSIQGIINGTSNVLTEMDVIDIARNLLKGASGRLPSFI